MLRNLLQRFRAASPPALATVLLREDRIFVQASDRTAMRSAGYWVAAGPVETLAATAEPARIGQAVLDALARSRVEVAVPERGADLEEPLRRAAGVRSRRALRAGTCACSVEREGGTLRIEASRSGGAAGEGRAGRPPLEEATIHLDAASTADAVGRAVLDAMRRATAEPEAPVA